MINFFIPPDSSMPPSWPKYIRLNGIMRSIPILQSIKATTLIGMVYSRCLSIKRTGVRSHLSISANTELGGVVGNPIKRFGRDFGLTEEFVEAYRIHSMLPETLEIRDIHSKQMMADIPFTASRHIGAAACMYTYGPSALWYSLGNISSLACWTRILSLTQHRPDFHSGKVR